MMRIWLAAALMALAVAGAYVLTPGRLSAGENVPDLEEMVPDVIGEWHLDDSARAVLPREEESEESLTARLYDRTLIRTYRNADGDRVMLVIAYGRDQSDALQLHLPEVCYASQGFAVEMAGRKAIGLGRSIVLPVIRLKTRRGRRHEPVTYWTRVGDTVVLSRLTRQWAKLSYGLRGKVPDGVLVRVSTISRQTGRAFAVQEHFIRDLLRAVDPAQRPFFLGDTTRMQG